MPGSSPGMTTEGEARDRFDKLVIASVAKQSRIFRGNSLDCLVALLRAEAQTLMVRIGANGACE